MWSSNGEGAERGGRCVGGAMCVSVVDANGLPRARVLYPSQSDSATAALDVMSLCTHLITKSFAYTAESKNTWQDMSVKKLFINATYGYNVKNDERCSKANTY